MSNEPTTEAGRALAYARIDVEYYKTPLLDRILAIEDQAAHAALKRWRWAVTELFGDGADDLVDTLLAQTSDE